MQQGFMNHIPHGLRFARPFWKKIMSAFIYLNIVIAIERISL